MISREPSRHGSARWLCECDCGNTTVVYGVALGDGTIKSCGCGKEHSGPRQYGYARRTHPKLRAIWADMKQRCENPHRPQHKRYGARGISICQEWQDPNAFISWSLENGYAPDLCIDRIDNDGDYSPNNCRWVSNKENCRNKRNNVFLTIDGVTKCVTEWSEIKKVHRSTLSKWVHQRGKEYAEQKLLDIPYRIQISK